MPCATETHGEEINLPNGIHSSDKETWDRIERPLVSLDSDIKHFARTHRMEIVNGYHNYPSRHLNWKKSGMWRSIQIVPDETGSRITVGICAWRRVLLNQYSKGITLKQGVSPEKMKTDIQAILSQAFEVLSSWTKKDLELQE